MTVKKGADGRRNLTPFGIAVRKFRLDRGLRLKDMAEALGCSQPFLSAVETGTKPVPADMVSEIERLYEPVQQELKSLKDAELMSNATIQIDWSALPAEERREILAFLKSKGAFPVRRGRTVLGEVERTSGVVDDGAAVPDTLIDAIHLRLAPETIEHMIRNGAGVNEGDLWGDSAFGLAAKMIIYGGSKEQAYGRAVAHLLLEHGTDPYLCGGWMKPKEDEAEEHRARRMEVEELCNVYLTKEDIKETRASENNDGELTR